MEILEAVCAVLSTLFLGILTVLVVVTLLKVRKVILQAGEAAKNVNDKVQAVKDVASVVRSFTDGTKSGWVKTGQVMFGTLSAIRNLFRSDQEEKEERPAEKHD